MTINFSNLPLAFPKKMTPSRNLLLLVLVIIFQTAVSKPFKDWLVSRIDTKSSFSKTPKGTVVLSNGLIQREFLLHPNLATIDLYSYEKKSSVIRALGPETVIELDGVVFNVGGVVSSNFRAYMNRSEQNFQNDENAFQLVSHKTRAPEVDFPYAPQRGAPKDISWPPKGLGVDFLFKAPPNASPEHQLVEVMVSYEIYDGMPLMSKWVTVYKRGGDENVVKVRFLDVETLYVNQQWSPVTFDSRSALTNFGWLFVETDRAHGTEVVWDKDGSEADDWGSFEPYFNCTYSPQVSITVTKRGIKSFKVHELLIGSSDAERAALSRHRMFRLLAPHTQENPIFFHMTNSSPSAVRNVIDQMAEVGFEMLIYSFGSGFHIESTNETYIAEVKAVIDYAHARGIEVGGYDLISLTRTTPNASWMAVDVNGKSIGSACFASHWYDQLLERFLYFINKTGPFLDYEFMTKVH